MELNEITTIISTLGFPIVCTLAMGWFIFEIYKKQTAQQEANMEKVQARCAERENRLYEELARGREINNKAIETIAKYSEKLDNIQTDIDDIKKEITILAAR